jgi:hypothetical protein
MVMSVADGVSAAAEGPGWPRCLPGQHDSLRVDEERPCPRANQPSFHLQQYPAQVQNSAMVRYLERL